MRPETQESVHEKIANYVRNHPEMTLREIGIYLKISTPTICEIARKYGVFRNKKYIIDPELLAKLEE